MKRQTFDCLLLVLCIHTDTQLLTTTQLIEQCLTSPPTQWRLSKRQFYSSKDPTNSIKVLKEKTIQK